MPTVDPRAQLAATSRRPRVRARATRAVRAAMPPTSGCPAQVPHPAPTTRSCADPSIRLTSKVEATLPPERSGGEILYANFHV